MELFLFYQADEDLVARYKSLEEELARQYRTSASRSFEVQVREAEVRLLSAAIDDAHEACEAYVSRHTSLGLLLFALPPSTVIDHCFSARTTFPFEVHGDVFPASSRCHILKEVLTVFLYHNKNGMT